MIINRPWLTFSFCKDTTDPADAFADAPASELAEASADPEAVATCTYNSD